LLIFMSIFWCVRCWSNVSRTRLPQIAAIINRRRIYLRFSRRWSADELID
jgi:hypothetical protein